MNKPLVAIVLSLIVGVAAALFVVASGPPAAPIVVNENPGLNKAFDQAAPLQERIRALEQAVSEEREARQLLQEEVLYLSTALEAASDADSGAAEDATSEQGMSRSRAARRAEFRRRSSPEGRTQRLIDGGFLPGQADWIVRRESELQMEALQARYDAEKSGAPVPGFRSRSFADGTLRSELGDADYERYLEANGRPISIAISNVMESSPGQRAGLQIGDEIVRYDGARVFSVSDLNRQTMQGEAGMNVVVDIVRDSVPMQVVLPRGPVGISAGRR